MIYKRYIPTKMRFMQQPYLGDGAIAIYALSGQMLMEYVTAARATLVSELPTQWVLASMPP